MKTKQKTTPLKKKIAYKVTNWKDYNAALVSRGSVAVWVSDDALAVWHDVTPSGKAGHPKTYSDLAIQTALTIQAVYQLPLRATEGFLSSLLHMMGAMVKCPDYSSLSYRGKTLKVTLSSKVQAALKRGEAINIAVDSTGVKIYGEGEWKVRKHGYSKHRTWRKIHLGVSTSGSSKHLIPTSEMTGNGVGDGDGQTLPKLLTELAAECPDISLADLCGDGAYDTRDCYEAIKAIGARAVIPPQKNAKIWRHGNTKADKHSRDQQLRRIRKVGRTAWKQETNYHKRSLSETAMFRFKTIFGDTLPARLFENQRTQSKIRAQALNQMTLLGMPRSVPVAVPT